ncbi:MAG: ABC transporter permease [Candidatus Woesearchaeota archaeon]
MFIDLEIIKYSLKNLWSRKMRSFLTILSIFIGISAIFIFASFGIGLYSYVGEIAAESGLDKFMVQAKGIGAPGLDNTFKLEQKDLDAISRIKGVKETSFWYLKPGQIDKDKVKKFVFLAGVGEEKTDIKLLEEMMTVKILSGRNLKKGDRGKVTVGYNYQLPDKIFKKPYKIGEKMNINGVDFEIIGFWEEIGNPGDDSNVYMFEDDMKSLFGEDITYAVLIGRAEDPENMDALVEKVEKELRKVRGLEEGKEDFTVQSFADAFEMFTSIINIVVGFIFLIVLISGIVASVNTANTMVTSVLERIKEIGVMKSIGARNSTIRNIFLIESGILGFVAGIFGITFGWFLSYYGGVILNGLGWGFLAPRFPIWLFIFCVLLSTVVGTVSGVAPAIYASKQKPVDALRYE